MCYILIKGEGCLIIGILVCCISKKAFISLRPTATALPVDAAPLHAYALACFLLVLVCACLSNAHFFVVPCVHLVFFG